MKAVRINSPELQAFETEHISAVRSLSPECMVLLKNDGTLPIAKGGKLALYGSGARRTIKGGTGSGDVNSRSYVTVEEGLKNAGFSITTSEWLDAYDTAVTKAKKDFYGEIRKQADEAGMNPIFFSMGKVAPEPDYNFPLNGEGDVAVYVLARISGEGADRTPTAGDINLTEAEIRDINALNEKYEKFILVLNTGGMVDLSPVGDVKTVLIMGQLGVATGDALADVLTGVSYPSGKLTMTWAPIAAYPSTEGFGHPDDTYYKEGIYVGYRYFDSANVEPIYPFGYGLGYTSFTVTADDVQVKDHIVTVNVMVKNTGNTAGKEVVQIYYSAPSDTIDKPYQELAAYAKTKELKAGECEKISVSFSLESMASYDEKKAAWIMEKGLYYIRVGNSSRNTSIAAAISLSADVITEQDCNICGTPGFEDQTYKAGVLYETEEAEKTNASVIELSADDVASKVISYQDLPEEIPAGETITWDRVEAGEKTVQEFAAGLTEDQLAYLCIGDYFDSDDMMEVIGNASSTVAGAAGETTNRLKDLGLPSLVMADGPAGLRLSQNYKLIDGVAKGASSLGGDMMLVFTDEELAGMAAGAENEDTKALETYYQYCVAIPIGTAIAQSFNDDLAETCGKLVGEEMRMFNCPIWLAPALNIYRSPLCGRNFEYYSEDPVVSGRIAAAITNGVQTSQDCATTIKHYAFNNQETNRYFSCSNLSERAMREIYLKGFEICVKNSQPQFIMTSYNLINGEHTCNSYDLNTKVLRDEWGFEGVVMTDWLVTGGMGPQGSKYPCASAAGNVKAGNDITMPGLPSDKADIMRALEDDTHAYHLTKAELQLSAIRVLEKILTMTNAAK